MAILPYVVLVVSLGTPGVAVWIALFALTRRVRRRTGAPAVAIHAATACIVLAGLLIATGILGSIHAVVRSEQLAGTREEKARALGGWMSHALRFGRFGLVLAIIGLVWVGFCSWRWRKPRMSGRE